MVSRYPPYRTASSVGLLLAVTGACLHYLTRDPRPTPVGTSVIDYVSDYGPIWPVTFGTAAAALAATLLLGRGLHVAHTLAAGVLAAYGFALFYTAATTGTGWVTACFAVGMTVHAIALAASYAQDGGRVAWTRHWSGRSSPGSSGSSPPSAG